MVVCLVFDDCIYCKGKSYGCCSSAVHDMGARSSSEHSVELFRCGPVTVFFASLAAFGDTRTSQPSLNAPANAASATNGQRRVCYEVSST